MGVRTLRMAAGAVMVGVAFVAVGCAAGGGSAPSKQPGAAASRVLPVPFTVTARYTAKMLGLSHPDALAIGSDGNLYVSDLSQRVSGPQDLLARRKRQRCEPRRCAMPVPAMTPGGRSEAGNPMTPWQGPSSARCAAT